MTSICIAIDAMGGDHGPRVTVPAALQALSKYTNLRLVLVGKQDVLEEVLQNYPGYDLSRLTIRNATQVVGMDELPSYALRGKKDSSMRVALNLVQEGMAQACISAGNTGALMAIARYVLKMLPGVDRPAILFALPSIKGPVNVLDLGANVDCQADHLFQFAVMGSVVTQAVDNKPNPKIGLLNIGSEAIKGTDQVKRAGQLLENVREINYVGFIEGDDIYKGSVDVVVCDGFVGNVVLKASEGLAKMMLHFAKQEFSSNWYNKIVSQLAKPILRKFFSRFNPNNYNGGSLLGLQGIVIKSHGDANQEAFITTISIAMKEVEKNVTEKIKNTVSSRLENCELV